MIERVRASFSDRATLVTAGLIGLLAVITQMVLPGATGSDGRGTPLGIIFNGAVLGLVFSLMAGGIVLIYRTLRIINFAQAALGAAGAMFTFELIRYTAVPFPIAMVLGVVVGALTGTLVGLVLLRFLNSSRLVLTVVTIVGAQFLVGLTSQVQSLPFFPPQSERTIEQITGSEPIRDILPFPGFTFRIGDFGQRFGFPEVFSLEVALLSLAALAVFLRFTRSGTAVRAVADNPERAGLLGISVGGLSVLIWTIAGALSAIGLILVGMLTVPAAVNIGATPQTLIAAFAAAVLARMVSIPAAVAFQVGLAIFIQAFNWSYPQHQQLIFAVILVAIAAALVVRYRRTARSEQGAGTTWAASEEQRPIPRELRSLPIVRNTRLVLVALAVIIVVAVPFFSSTLFLNLYSTAALTGIVVLSVVVLTGWAGQVSLGQWAFAAVGAVVAGGLTGTAGLSFWLAVPVGAVTAGAIAVLIGIPALRIPGLFLLVVTYGFALVVEGTLFNESYFGWLLPEGGVERPTLFFLDFEDDVSMYFLCVGALVLSIVAVLNLRRSRIGRILIALRENDATVQTFGVPVVRTKLIAFAVAGVLAGFAGAVFVHHQRAISADAFAAQNSIFAFTNAVFGGIGSVAGALIGAGFFIAIFEFINNDLALTFIGEGGTLIILFAAPGGVISLVNMVRDSALRIVAQRRQLVVPSLFADYDPEALENRLIPLKSLEGERSLADSGRFTLASELYAGTGRRIRDLLAPKKVAAETAVLDAAARAVERAEEDAAVEAAAASASVDDTSRSDTGLDGAVAASARGEDR